METSFALAERPEQVAETCRDLHGKAPPPFKPIVIQPGFWQRMGLISAVALGTAALVWALRRG